MDRFAKLVTLAALLGVSGTALAFVFPSPPPGFAGSPGNWTFAPPSGAQQIDGIIRQSGALSVPTAGGAAKLPVGFKLKAAAARVAAAAVFAHPAVRTATGIAAWLGTGKIIYDTAESMWREGEPPQTGTQYRIYAQNAWRWSKEYACLDHATNLGYQVISSASNCQIGRNGVVYASTSYTTRVVTVPTCPDGWQLTPAGCLGPAITQTQFEDSLVGKPMPQSVPGELPSPTRLPVEDPVINPTPGPTPAHQPYFVPTGNPVPNPSYDPALPSSPSNQPWLQPGVRIVPSPTAAEPWRVEVQPVNKPQETDQPAEPGTETGDGGSKPKPEEQQSLCEKHPDILACQKLDTPDDVELPNSEKPISITPDGGWGADNAACPAPRVLTVQGRQIPIPFDLFCTYMSGIRPIVIAMAWLSAAFILLGARESNG